MFSERATFSAGIIRSGLARAAEIHGGVAISPVFCAAAFAFRAGMAAIRSIPASARAAS